MGEDSVIMCLEVLRRVSQLRVRRQIENTQTLPDVRTRTYLKTLIGSAYSNKRRFFR